MLTKKDAALMLRKSPEVKELEARSAVYEEMFFQHTGHLAEELIRLEWDAEPTPIKQMATASKKDKSEMKKAMRDAFRKKPRVALPEFVLASRDGVELLLPVRYKAEYAGLINFLVGYHELILGQLGRPNVYNYQGFAAMRVRHAGFDGFDRLLPRLRESPDYFDLFRIYPNPVVISYPFASDEETTKTKTAKAQKAKPEEKIQRRGITSEILEYFEHHERLDMDGYANERGLKKRQVYNALYAMQRAGRASFVDANTAVLSKKAQASQTQPSAGAKDTKDGSVDTPVAVVPLSVALPTTEPAPGYVESHAEIIAPGGAASAAPAESVAGAPPSAKKSRGRHGVTEEQWVEALRKYKGDVRLATQELKRSRNAFYTGLPRWGYETADSFFQAHKITKGHEEKTSDEPKDDFGEALAREAASARRARRGEQPRYKARPAGAQSSADVPIVALEDEGETGGMKPDKDSATHGLTGAAEREAVLVADQAPEPAANDTSALERELFDGHSKMPEPMATASDDSDDVEPEGAAAPGYLMRRLLEYLGKEGIASLPELRRELGIQDDAFIVGAVSSGHIRHTGHGVYELDEKGSRKLAEYEPPGHVPEASQRVSEKAPEGRPAEVEGDKSLRSVLEYLDGKVATLSQIKRETGVSEAACFQYSKDGQISHISGGLYERTKQGDQTLAAFRGADKSPKTIDATGGDDVGDSKSYGSTGAPAHGRDENHSSDGQQAYARPHAPVQTYVPPDPASVGVSHSTAQVLEYMIEKGKGYAETQRELEDRFGRDAVRSALADNLLHRNGKNCSITHRGLDRAFMLASS